MRKQPVLLALAGLSALTLAGCGTVRETFDTRQNVGPCPTAAALYDAARIVEIRGEEFVQNIGFTGEVLSVSSTCRDVGDAPISMSVNVEFAFGRGDAAQGESAKVYPYFVAVTRRNLATIAKERFAVEARFRPGEDVVVVRDRIEEILIPRANPDISGVNFEVLIGFELTAEQLEFNRAGKRFRMLAGSTN